MPISSALKACAYGLLVFACALHDAAARELGSAPEVEIIGFSPDRRYFAYEQYLHDSLDEISTMVIDVVDRTTGRSADGFPVGFFGVGADGDYPARLGDGEIALTAGLTGLAGLADMQRAVRHAARPALAKLGIDRGDYRRLAGSPATDRAPPPQFDFVHFATLPGFVPDMQEVYRVRARFEPAMRKACSDGAASISDGAVAIDIETVDPRSGEARPIGAERIAWPLPAGDCPFEVRITDILTMPYGKENPTDIVTAVVVLAVSTGPHSESARYLARFLELP